MIQKSKKIGISIVIACIVALVTLHSDLYPLLSSYDYQIQQYNECVESYSPYLSGNTNCGVASEYLFYPYDCIALLSNDFGLDKHSECNSSHRHIDENNNQGSLQRICSERYKNRLNSVSVAIILRLFTGSMQFSRPLSALHCVHTLFNSPSDEPFSLNS